MIYNAKSQMTLIQCVKKNDIKGQSFSSFSRVLRECICSKENVTKHCSNKNQYPLMRNNPRLHSEMASTGGSGNNPGGSEYGGSGSGNQKATDPTVPRSGPWQQKPRTKCEWEQEPARPQCLDGRCNHPDHKPSGESNYTHEKKK